MVNSKNVPTGIKYFFLFLLIATSGMPFFTAKDNLITAIVFIVSCLYFILKGFRIKTFVFWVIVFLCVITLGQTIKFNYLDPITTIGLFLRWLIPFFIITIVGNDFVEHYINIIYYLVIISFVFFIPSILIPGFEEFLLNNIAPIFNQNSLGAYSYNENILIYTIKTGVTLGWDTYRNSGPFWEPGAFAGYCNIALLFNIAINKKIFNKIGIILLLAVFSTFSGAGYLTTFFILISYYILINHHRGRWLIGIVFVIIAYFSIINIPRINTKLGIALEQLSYENVNNLGSSRMVSARLDIQDAVKNPIFGKGRNQFTRFDQGEYSMHRNNGLTDLLVKYGVPFWAFYFYFIYVSFRNISVFYGIDKSFALIAMGAIGIMGFAEVYFQSFFFIGLFYLHLNYRNGARK